MMMMIFHVVYRVQYLGSSILSFELIRMVQTIAMLTHLLELFLCGDRYEMMRGGGGDSGDGDDYRY